MIIRLLWTARVCRSYYSYVNEFCAILLSRLILGFAASSSPRPRAFCLVPRLVLEETASCTSLSIYRYLIISTRARWHMIKFKIHAPKCTRTRHFYVKKIKNFLGRGTAPSPTRPLPIPIPQREGTPGGGASNSLAPALRTDKATMN